jgi:hypothetical protein
MVFCQPERTAERCMFGFSWKMVLLIFSKFKGCKEILSYYKGSWKRALKGIYPELPWL